MDLPGPIQEKFRIEGPLGAGAQGSVFRGSLEGRPVAVKILPCRGDERRIEREIGLLRNAESPYLAAIKDDLRVDFGGEVYWALAYELIDGRDLRSDVLQAGVPLTSTDAVTLAASMVEALEVLWRSRVVHRDVKPANIMRSGSRFVLVDLGLARFLDLSSVTGAGLVVGTPLYMSPEQALGRRNLTINSDLFSLGVTLFELLTLRHPFRADLHRILGAEPEGLGAIQETLPPLLVDGIWGVLDKRPAARLGVARRCFAANVGA